MAALFAYRDCMLDTSVYFLDAPKDNHNRDGQQP